MTQAHSIAARLSDRIRALADDLWEMLSQVPVVRSKPLDFVVIPPPSDYHWGFLTPKLLASQHRAKREYETLFELMRVLLHHAPEQLGRELGTADERFRHWLELNHRNYALSPDLEVTESAYREDMSAFDRVLETLAASGAGTIFVVPDTNSLLSRPDPKDYSTVAGCETFTFMLLPSVLGELDRLKIEHRNPDVREKALKMVTRIKGWRLQGSLNVGVTVSHSIKVQALHREPCMGQSLSWLDPEVEDDRILASVLELQAQNPAASVVLVTDDINMQNKADAALVMVVETP